MRKQLLGLMSMVLGGATITAQPGPIVPPMIQGGPGPMDLAPGLMPGPGMIPPGADPGQMLQGAPQYPAPGPYAQQRYQSQAIGNFAGGAPAPLFWFDGQYLLMFPKKAPSGAPLVTTSDNLTAFGKIIPGNSTRILHGGEDFKLGPASGFRFTGGFWRPEDQRFGLEVSGMYVGPSSDIFGGSSGSGGSPLFARPFFNTNANTPIVGGGFGPGNDAVIVTTPTTQTGFVYSQASHRAWSVEADGLMNIYRSNPNDTSYSLSFVGGYRYFEVDEFVRVFSHTNVINGGLVTVGGVNVASGGFYEITDLFNTSNKFHGAQLGIQSQYTSGRWLSSINAKVAAGLNSQRIEIDGNTFASVGAVTNRSLGGLLANSSNIGIQQRTVFALLTDINANLGYMFTPRLIGQVGYNFIHLSNAVRPGDVYGGSVDPTLAPASPNFGTSPPRGAPPKFIDRDDYYIHGANFGLLLRF